MSRPPDAPADLTQEQRARLLAAVRALRGATLQKVWLPSPALAVLQLRVPGRTALAILDARLALAALADERPTSSESSPKSQATLRSAIEGARLADARLEAEAGGGPASVRLTFDTAAGPRALVAESGIHALLLVGPSRDGGERIVWAAAGAGTERRPGAPYRDVIALPPMEPAAAGDDRDLLRRAVAREEESGLSARRKALERALRARLQKLRRKLAAVEEDASRAAAATGERRKAELLVPHQGAIPRGAAEARVPDWSALDESGAPREVVLKLDPARSAAENVARWFRRAARYAAAEARIAARRSEVASEIAAAEALLLRAAAIGDAAALGAVETAARVPARRVDRSAGRTARRVPWRAFRSRSGARVLVGRSARDNEALLRSAKGNDLWLHGRGTAGSHVVVPDPGEALDPRTVRDAALLAAHFSSARGADAAEVAYTRRKHVRKPKGAAPGAVTYSQERTVRVRLDADALRELLASEEA